LQASTYHQLGVVAQQQRQWPQAEQYYQQALQIYIDFKDRYLQASTYHQLGVVAQQQRQWPQAKEFFLQALSIFVAANDQYSFDIVMRSLTRLWQASNDKDIPAAVAKIFDNSTDEIEKLFQRLLDQENKE
jgi:tetratricopeptide (TPR) repeat protein